MGQLRCQFCADKLRMSDDREVQACGACRGTDWFIHQRWEIMLALKVALKKRK